MENISQLLAQCESSQEESDCDSVVMGNLRSVSSTKSSRSRRESGTSTDKDTMEKKYVRNPTRKPDPKIYNRNALLARENRRKKKAHLETIEKELDDIRNTNKLLLKALKKQMKTTQRLEQERSYFKNILANRTEITKLMSAINSQMQNKREPTSFLRRYASSSSSDDFPVMPSSSSSSIADHGTVEQKQTSEPIFNTNGGISNFIDEYFTDLQPLTDAVSDSWNDLLQDEEFGLGGGSGGSGGVSDNRTCTSPQTSEGNASTDYQIGDDHSYVTLTNAITNNEDFISNTMSNLNNIESGVCLHITGGKVSLEFCPSCHWKASSTPPMQVLQNELDTIA